MSRHLKCPHCGADITWLVKDLVEDELRDDTGGTTFAKCDDCRAGFSVGVCVDINIGKKSFAEAHPELAAVAEARSADAPQSVLSDADHMRET